MTEEDFIVSHITPSGSNQNDDLLRAVIPSHLYEIRSTQEERLIQDELAGYINYRVPLHNSDGSVKATFLFRFQIVDWRFHWSGENSNSLQLTLETLNRQFSELSHYSEHLWGTNFDFPLAIYTKVQITKLGRYFYQAGLVLGHTGRNLRVQTADGSIIYLRQQFTVVLDPNHTLPFGVPYQG